MVSLIKVGLNNLGLDEGLYVYFPFQELVAYALTEGSDYWAGLAMTWLEQRMPSNAEVNDALAGAVRNQRFSQRLRHRAHLLLHHSPD